MRHRIISLAASTAAIVLSFAAIAAAQISWERAHANAMNDGFLDVSTAPAGRGSLSIPNIGRFANGVGPVAGTDGTVYIGNMAGKVFAFRANGTPAWSRELPHGHVISAAPVVTSDGSVFVVSGTTVHDHRGGQDHTRRDLFLHRFTSGGGWSGPAVS